MRGIRLHTHAHTHTAYIPTHKHIYTLHEVTQCMVVWCTQNPPRWQQFHVAPAMPVPTAVDIQKRIIKKKEAASHSRRITCKHSESAQDWRIALYKSDQQQLMELLIFKNGINFMYKTGRIVTEIKAIPTQEEGMLFN